MNPIIHKIKTYLNTQQAVVAVYIFGSYAANKERIHSDIDIAILIDPENTYEMNKLHSTYLAKLSRLTRMDIDLIIMNIAGEGLLKQIYKKGQCILSKDDEKLSVFNMISYSKIADFGYHYEKMKASVVKSVTEEPSIG